MQTIFIVTLFNDLQGGSLGMIGPNRFDEFSENFQTASDRIGSEMTPSPLQKFSENSSKIVQVMLP